MAVRRPLVLVSGAVRELPTGDAIPAMGGWVDCSAMTTVTEINAAAAAAPAGSTIWLGPRPASSPLVVDATLIVQERQRWLGAGGRNGLTVLEAAAGLGSGLPMMASIGWYNNAPDADEGIWIEGIKFDLNAKTGRHGLVVYNFWSSFTDLHFVDGDGSASHALHVTDRARDTTTISSNSHSENRFWALRFDNTTGGAAQFYAESNNNISNQDGHLTDSFFAGADGPCVFIGRAAGWTVENNHLYGVGTNGIDLLNCYATKCIGNYVKDFGTNNVAAAFYSGISMTMLSGKPSICANNSVTLDEPTTALYTRAVCISVRAGSAQTDARVAVVGNAVSIEVDDLLASEAFRIGEAGDTGRTLYFSFVGNLLNDRDNFVSQIFRSNGSTRQMKDAPGVRAYTGVTGTHTLDNECEMIQNFTVTGNVEIDPPASNVHARDGEPFQLCFLASGGTRTITFDATMRTSTGVTRGPHSVASGEVLRAAVEWSSLVTDYIITAVTVSAN